MTILPALSSATISSVEARVFCIALYFKLRRGFWASARDPTCNIEAISRFSDSKCP
jgi:hypothetical protein